jgi:hypothetical protein
VEEGVLTSDLEDEEVLLIEAETLGVADSEAEEVLLTETDALGVADLETEAEALELELEAPQLP